MATVKEILQSKSGKVLTIAPTATVLQATQKMNQHKIGALVVTEGSQIVGIFTERDVLQRVMGATLSPSEMLVAGVMTRDVVCCGPNEQMDEVGAIMKDRRIRHIPVCGDGGELLGMISIGDINAMHASHQLTTIHFLNEYIYGRA